MTHLRWRDANLRGGTDKKSLQRFRCTNEDLKTVVAPVGSSVAHSRLYEWHVQQLIREDVRSLNKKRWIVRLGFDDHGLGAVVVAEELVPGKDYYVAVGAIAARLRGKFRGELGDELMEDIFGAIGQRCVEAGSSGEARLTGVIHKENVRSKLMCERNGWAYVDVCADDINLEDWSRMLPIPDPTLFADLPNDSDQNWSTHGPARG